MEGNYRGWYGGFLFLGAVVLSLMGGCPNFNNELYIFLGWRVIGWMKGMFR